MTNDRKKNQLIQYSGRRIMATSGPILFGPNKELFVLDIFSKNPNLLQRVVTLSGVHCTLACIKPDNKKLLHYDEMIK